MTDYEKLLEILTLMNEWQLKLCDADLDKKYLEKLYALVDKQRRG